MRPAKTDDQHGATAQVTWCYMTDPEGNIVELQARAQGD